MRMLRIEAERFGRIGGRALGDLSPALSVVLGPNEAGKSSFTALVRHVLYGFPTPGDVKEAPYVSDAGKRQGRLVFADGDGEWVVERVEGPRGGTVSVRTLSGRPRDGLLDELTRGVSRLAYQVVFGFGLADMHKIEQLKGKDDDLLSRLYAAGAGLTVSPPDVRRTLADRMEWLWKKGGSNPVINQERALRERVRGQIRTLEADAEAFRSESEHLLSLEGQLETARESRSETRARAERLTRALGDVERLEREAAAADVRARDARIAAGESQRGAEAIALDEAALAIADAAGEIQAGLPVFKGHLEALEQRERDLEAVERRLRSAVDEAGWSEEAALAATTDAGIRVGIEEARHELDELRFKVKAATEERDASRAETARAADVSGPIGHPWAVPGVVVAVLGVAGVIAGFVLGQPGLTGFGVVMLVAGIVLAVMRPQGVATNPSSTARADAALASAQGALDERTAAWSAWVRGHGLGDGSEQPSAIAGRLEAARRVREADGDRVAARAAAVRERGHVAAYVERVRTLAAPLFGEDVSVDASTAEGLVGRVVARVETARRSQHDREARLAVAAQSSQQAEAESAAAAGAREAAAEQLAAVCLAGATLEDLRCAEAEARTESEDALAAFDRLAGEAAGLKAKIAEEQRENALSGLRLDEVTISERIARDTREYATLAVADRLLALAQERYERDRQPEVVRRAEAEFARMTNGRYTRLSVPLGKDAIEVFDSSAAASGPDHLSRGTAEQLYLALRLGLIDQLGDVGQGLPILMDDVLVNFSPERQEQAARAIAELAERRQVVFFTCHPSMAELLMRVAPKAARLDLDVSA
jgi:uncharacterized protein YhaN